MTTEEAWAAREVLVIRELLERAELREMCLQALAGRPGADLLEACTERLPAQGLTCRLPRLASPRLAALAPRRGRS